MKNSPKDGADANLWQIMQARESDRWLNVNHPE
jgi:hypothetical protein